MTWRVRRTVSSSQGIMRSVLSNTRDTLVNDALPFPLPPSNMRSVSFPARTALELFGPRTNRIASVMFDLPDPFGPVTAVYPSMRGTVSLPPKDLKFSISTAFKYNLCTPCDAGHLPASFDMLPDARPLPFTQARAYHKSEGVRNI